MEAIPKATKGFLSKTFLADRFDEVLGKLDRTINEAITALEKHTLHVQDDTGRQDLEDSVRRLDNSIFQLRIWASDLTCQDPTSTLGSLAMRDLEAHDVLRVIEGHQMPVGDSLHGTFTRIEAAASQISDSLSLSNFWDLDKAIIDIEQSLLELDSQKTNTQKRIIGMTIEDVERALSSATSTFAQGSVLSIGTLKSSSTGQHSNHTC